MEKITVYLRFFDIYEFTFIIYCLLYINFKLKLRNTIHLCISFNFPDVH